MLPKADKKKEKAEQLDLVETISEADKSRHKRQTTLLFLFLTVGVSLIFLIYRQAKNFNFQLPKLPAINLNFSKTPPSFTPDFPLSWSTHVSTVGSTLYSFASPPALSPDFSQFKTSVDDALAKKDLPQGVKVIEKQIFADNSTQILSDISTPKISFRLYVHIPGDINQQPESAQNYSRLAKDIYWYLIKRVEESD